MAEDLDIRALWNKSKEKEDPTSLHINMLEKKGTKTTLYWIKTILWIEFWINVVCLPLFIKFDLTRNEGSYFFIVFYIIITLIYLFYYQFLIREINRFSYDGNVIESLKKVYGYLRFYILHYKVVIWVSLIIGVIYGLFYDPQNEELLEKIQSVKDWLILSAIYVVLIGIVGGILHWLIHLIYGRKIKRLKRMVKDLESEE